MRPTLPLLLCFCLLTASATAEEWGTLTGRFAWPERADIPQAERLTITKDQTVCGPPMLVDEGLVIDRKTRGVANIVLWLDSKEEVPTHPDLKVPTEPAVLDNAKCRFEPHVLLVRPGQPLKVTNSDPVTHAVAIYFFKNDPLSVSLPGNDETLTEGETFTRTLTEAEPLPVSVTCPIHSWMTGFILMKDTPYVAKTDHVGRFTIPKLPIGTWTFRVWHERAGYLDGVTSGEETQTFEKGRMTVTVTAEGVDLGVLTVDVEEFAEDE